MAGLVIPTTPNVNEFLRLWPMTPPCGTHPVTDTSLFPTRDCWFHPMYLRCNLSFYKDGRSIPEEEEDESLYRGRLGGNRRALG
jgi:hypothetical protein